MNEEAEFAGQVVLISGAAQGIGAALARAFAARGAHLALLDVQAEAVQAQARDWQGQGVPALGLGCDVSHWQQVAAAVERVETELGPVHCLLHAAAILRMGTLLDSPREDWERSLAVNSSGLFNLAREVGVRMRARRSGNMIAITSNAASVPRMQMGAYAASKAAAAQFMRCLGLELAEYGVRCNTISPGSTDTAMQRQCWQGQDEQAARQAVIGGNLSQHRLGIPLQRIADADDIAQAALFLASKAARHITLHDLRVDGGATLDA